MCRDFQRLIVTVALALTAVAPASSLADKIVLRIRAANPADQPQSVRIKSHLPAGVTTNNIIDLGGLELDYDVKTDTYFVFREMELGPKRNELFEVVLDDIWFVPEDEIDRYAEHARQLVRKLSGSASQENAEGLLAEIETRVAAILELQAANAISAGVKPMQHIRAYEANLEALTRVKTDLGYLENLVLGEGQNVGALIGDVKEAPLVAGGAPVPVDDYRTAVVRITVRNTSPRETRRVPISYDLPAEVKLQDILDSGELESGVRPGSGICYVHSLNVEIPPNDSRTFEVKIRDRWNVTAQRVKALRARLDEVVNRMGKRENYEAVEAALDTIRDRLAAMEAEEGPTDLDGAYVAFYRRQGERLDVIEQKIARIESALRPKTKETKHGFIAKAPSMKTTWLIIYIVLGFLAVMSLLFFLRWYGGRKP